MKTMQETMEKYCHGTKVYFEDNSEITREEALRRIGLEDAVPELDNVFILWMVQLLGLTAWKSRLVVEIVIIEKMREENKKSNKEMLRERQAVQGL